MMNLDGNPIIAAVRTREDFLEAVRAPVETIFLVNSSILTLGETIARARESGKKLYAHMDFADGVGKDRAGLEFLAGLGADGIISTRANIVKLAREVGLMTVQRFFIVDSHSVGTAAESIRASKPDTIEIMPGVLPRTIASFREKVKMPIIAGGLIETKADIIAAIGAGASAVSTAKKTLWFE